MRLLPIVLLASCAARTSAPAAPPVDPLALSLAEPLGSDIVPGSRVALFATHGSGTDRATTTHLAGCAEVLSTEPPSGLVVGVPRGFGLEVASIPAAADLRVARCAPDGSRLVAIPDEVPDRFLASVRAGDHAQVYVTLEGPPEPVTVTLLDDVALVGDPVGAIAASADGIERLVHALDSGRLALGVRRTPSEAPSFDHLATMIPEGLLHVAVELPDAAIPHPFLATTDYVDVTVVVEGTASTFLQAAFVYLLADDAGRSTVGLLLTPEQGEAVAHAAALLPTSLSLRSRTDVAYVDPADRDRAATPPPEADPADRDLPSSRIAHGTRAVSLPIEGAPPTVGGAVSIVGVAADGTRAEIARQRIVVAIAPPLVLVQVTPREVRAIALAGATYPRVVASPP